MDTIEHFSLIIQQRKMFVINSGHQFLIYLEFRHMSTYLDNLYSSSTEV